MPERGEDTATSEDLRLARQTPLSLCTPEIAAGRRRSSQSARSWCQSVLLHHFTLQRRLYYTRSLNLVVFVTQRDSATFLRQRKRGKQMEQSAYDVI